LTDFAFQVFKSFRARYLLNPFFAALPGDQVKQEYSQSGATSCCKHIEDKALTMPRYEAYNQKIVTERQKKERRIEHSHNDGSEVAQAK